jgi:hypothetical protein
VSWSEVAFRVVAYVAQGESHGKFWAQNRNTDNAGLSYGIVQWTQRGGGLGALLRSMYERDRRMFVQIFGPASAELLSVTNADTSDARMVPVGGAPLWQEPWTGRFTTAGQYGPFQTVQLEISARGVWMGEARKIGEHFGIRTERAYVLFFNRANQMGWNARKVAQNLPQGTDLSTYVAACASLYRSTGAQPGSGWRAVAERNGATAWHKFAGSVDLYDDVIRRCAKILSDPSLSDNPLVLA